MIINARNQTLGLIVVLAGIFAAPISGLAGDDTSIKGELRSDIKASMNQYIKFQSIDDAMYLYDPVEDKVHRMKLVKLHEGIKRKGNFFVSCADFTDQKGHKLDIDFMVRQRGSRLITTQAIVHAIDGNKRKYQLED